MIERLGIWVLRRIERTSPVPVHIWCSFADSLPEPHKSTMHRLIQEQRFTLPALMWLAEWLRDLRIARTVDERSIRRAPARPGVYVIISEGRYKVGWSSNMYDRLQTISTACPFPVGLAYAITTYKPQALEAHLHARFADKRLRREWFELNDGDLLYLADLAMRPEHVAAIVDPEV